MERIYRCAGTSARWLALVLGVLGIFTFERRGSPSAYCCLLLLSSSSSEAEAEPAHLPQRGAFSRSLISYTDAGNDVLSEHGGTFPSTLADV